jgi:hypothetical protein
LSREFGWTPEQIRNLTLDELEIYAELNAAYRDHIKPHDVSLERIRAALFSFFGIKEPPTMEQQELKLKQAANVTVTQGAMDAWFKAGMPSPAPQWLRQWEAENG